MKRWFGVISVTVLALVAFAGGALYYKHRTAIFLEELRKQPLTPERIAQAAQTMVPRQIDQTVLVLHRIGVARNSTVFYNFFIYNKYAELWRKYKSDPIPSSILEIGPGANVAVG